MAEPASNLRVSREYGDTIDVEMLQVANEIKMERYYRPVTEDERVALGEQLINLSTKLEDVEEEKKATTKMFNDQIKEIKASKKAALTPLRSGQMEEADAISYFMDPETHSVHGYNPKGKRVIVRRMTPEERKSIQTTINI